MADSTTKHSLRLVIKKRAVLAPPNDWRIPGPFVLYYDL